MEEGDDELVQRAAHVVSPVSELIGPIFAKPTTDAAVRIIQQVGEKEGLVVFMYRSLIFAHVDDLAEYPAIFCCCCGKTLGIEQKVRAFLEDAVNSSSTRSVKPIKRIIDEHVTKFHGAGDADAVDGLETHLRQQMERANVSKVLLEANQLEAKKDEIIKCLICRFNFVIPELFLDVLKEQCIGDWVQDLEFGLTRCCDICGFAKDKHDECPSAAQSDKSVVIQTIDAKHKRKNIVVKDNAALKGLLECRKQKIRTAFGDIWKDVHEMRHMVLRLAQTIAEQAPEWTEEASHIARVPSPDGRCVQFLLDTKNQVIAHARSSDGTLGPIVFDQATGFIITPPERKYHALLSSESTVDPLPGYVLNPSVPADFLVMNLWVDGLPGKEELLKNACASGPVNKRCLTHQLLLMGAQRYFAVGNANWKRLEAGTRMECLMFMLRKGSSDAQPSDNAIRGLKQASTEKAYAGAAAQVLKTLILLEHSTVIQLTSVVEREARRSREAHLGKGKLVIPTECVIAVGNEISKFFGSLVVTEENVVSGLLLKLAFSLRNQVHRGLMEAAYEAVVAEQLELEEPPSVRNNKRSVSEEKYQVGEVVGGDIEASEDDETAAIRLDAHYQLDGEVFLVGQDVVERMEELTTTQAIANDLLVRGWITEEVNLDLQSCELLCVSPSCLATMCAACNKAMLFFVGLALQKDHEIEMNARQGAAHRAQENGGKDAVHVNINVQGSFLRAMAQRYEARTNRNTSWMCMALKIAKRASMTNQPSQNFRLEVELNPQSSEPTFLIGSLAFTFENVAGWFDHVLQRLVDAYSKFIGRDLASSLASRDCEANKQFPMTIQGSALVPGVAYKPNVGHDQKRPRSDAGWSQVAEACRSTIVQSNPKEYAKLENELLGAILVCIYVFGTGTPRLENLCTFRFVPPNSDRGRGNIIGAQVVDEGNTMMFLGLSSKQDARGVSIIPSFVARGAVMLLTCVRPKSTSPSKGAGQASNPSQSLEWNSDAPYDLGMKLQPQNGSATAPDSWLSYKMTILQTSEIDALLKLTCSEGLDAALVRPLHLRHLLLELKDNLLKYLRSPFAQSRLTPDQKELLKSFEGRLNDLKSEEESFKMFALGGMHTAETARNIYTAQVGCGSGLDLPARLIDGAMLMAGGWRLLCTFLLDMAAQGKTTSEGQQETVDEYDREYRIPDNSPEGSSPWSVNLPSQTTYPELIGSSSVQVMRLLPRQDRSGQLFSASGLVTHTMMRVGDNSVSVTDEPIRLQVERLDTDPLEMSFKSFTPVAAASSDLHTSCLGEDVESMTEAALGTRNPIETVTGTEYASAVQATGALRPVRESRNPIEAIRGANYESLAAGSVTPSNTRIYTEAEFTPATVRIDAHNMQPPSSVQEQDSAAQTLEHGHCLGLLRRILGKEDAEPLSDAILPTISQLCRGKFEWMVVASPPGTGKTEAALAHHLEKDPLDSSFDLFVVTSAVVRKQFATRCELAGIKVAIVNPGEDFPATIPALRNRYGAVQVIVACPESIDAKRLVLMGLLEQARKMGMLGYIIIDECHNLAFNGAFRQGFRDLASLKHLQRPMVFMTGTYSGVVEWSIRSQFKFQHSPIVYRAEMVVESRLACSFVMLPSASKDDMLAMMFRDDGLIARGIAAMSESSATFVFFQSSRDLVDESHSTAKKIYKEHKKITMIVRVHSDVKDDANFTSAMSRPRDGVTLVFSTTAASEGFDFPRNVRLIVASSAVCYDGFTSMNQIAARASRGPPVPPSWPKPQVICLVEPESQWEGVRVNEKLASLAVSMPDHARAEMLRYHIMRSIRTVAGKNESLCGGVMLSRIGNGVDLADQDSMRSNDFEGCWQCKACLGDLWHYWGIGTPFARKDVTAMGGGTPSLRRPMPLPACVENAVGAVGFAPNWGAPFVKEASGFGSASSGANSTGETLGSTTEHEMVVVRAKGPQPNSATILQGTFRSSASTPPSSVLLSQAPRPTPPPKPRFYPTPPPTQGLSQTAEWNRVSMPGFSPTPPPTPGLCVHQTSGLMGQAQGFTKLELAYATDRERIEALVDILGDKLRRAEHSITPCLFCGLAESHEPSQCQSLQRTGLGCYACMRKTHTFQDMKARRDSIRNSGQHETPDRRFRGCFGLSRSWFPAICGFCHFKHPSSSGKLCGSFCGRLKLAERVMFWVFDGKHPPGVDMLRMVTKGELNKETTSWEDFFEWCLNPNVAGQQNLYSVVIAALNQQLVTVDATMVAQTRFYVRSSLPNNG